MISESHCWKNDLLQCAQQLRRRVYQRRWTRVSSARVEQTVMLGFYAVRKLIEAKKLSDDVANQTLKITTHPWQSQSVTRLNRFDYWELYDLDRGRTIVRSLAFLCNQVIHSYIFALSFDESNTFNGILVTSDRERHQALYFVQIQQIVDLFERIGHDDPDEVMFEFDSHLQDYRIKAKTKSHA